jgi:hypothetical protein
MARLYGFRTVSAPLCYWADLLQIPSNICCKWIGPGWFIPIISLCFGIASIGTAFVDNIHEICGVRFVLGVFEAGML